MIGGVLGPLGWELRKLAAQKRTYLGLVAALLTPVVFVGALSFQDKLPRDYPFGRFLHETGYATSLVLLGFVSIWLFPLLVSLVAGDIFASEDHNGTLKTILTRSVDRGEAFAAKAIAAALYSLAILTLMAVSAIVVGGAKFGFRGLTSLSGEQYSSGHALGLVAISWLLIVLPVLAFTAIAVFFSVATRNSAAGVVIPVFVALAMSLVGALNGVGELRHYLLTTQFEAFHGLFHAPRYDAQVFRALWVSAIYAAVPLVGALILFRRRDITSG